MASGDWHRIHNRILRFPIWLLEKRVLTNQERKDVTQALVSALSEVQLSSWTFQDTLDDIREAMQFLQLLAKPENHVQVPSNQYILKPYFTRTAGDMAAQMVQQLVSLKPYHAYAKILSGDDGKDIQKPEITTDPLPEGGGGMALEEALAQTRQELCVSRDEIDAEIRQRRNAWREAARPTPHQRHMGAGEPPDDPPPPHT